MVQLGQVELSNGADAFGPQLVDPRPHAAGGHGHQVGGPAADGVDQFQAHELVQPSEAEDVSVLGLTYSGRPGGKRSPGRAAFGPPQLDVQRAEPVLG